MCILILTIINFSNPTTPHIIETNEFGSVEGWGLNTSRDASQYILNENITTILKPKMFCELHTFLLIIVCSAPANFQNRNIIRNTWGSDRTVANKTVQVYFLVGEVYNSTLQQDLVEESAIYNDIVQDHFVDSYNNLTLKSIFMLKLVASHCKDTVQFLMKTDDDMFVNTLPLVNTLRKSNATKLLLGCLICHAKPIKDVNNKWYAPKYLFDGRLYPNYLSGTGYVMSIDVVPRLFEAALKTPIFYLEDIYITGILPKSIRLRPRNNPGFTFVKRNYDPCVFLTAFTSHRLSPMEIQDQYTALKRVNLSEDCRLQQERRNGTFSIFRYFSGTNVKPKKKKFTCV